MQLYALDNKKIIVNADVALRHQDHECLECGKRVRVRGGIHRQNHFYHLEPNRNCRLAGKGMEHLQAQYYFFNHLPAGEVRLEYRFPEIRRIADVAWLPHKIIFEIQYSSISAEEVASRNADYKKMGWEVVWILHDHRYNKKRLSAAEQALRLSTHYFTDMNAEGVGSFYDQFDLVARGFRQSIMGSLPIEFNKMKRIRQEGGSNRLCLVDLRLKHWALSFKGDLIDVNSQLKASYYLETALELERQTKERETKTINQLTKRQIISFILNKFFFRPYQLLFQILLEKSCR
jgi:competence protein CoiA